MRWLLPGLLSLGTLSLLIALAMIYFLLPQLPDPQGLRSIEFQVPLTVYAKDGSLIGEFGEQKRIPIKLEQTPQQLRDAIIAAEDDQFYSHMGVDWVGLLRAGIELLRTGEKRQGGSTITMQVARNFFLSREKTYLRKITEILLAVKIEKQLSKDEILELYVNKIFLGQRAYGFGAAAQVYYGTDLNQLSLAQLAMLAGLPKAPSRFNPVRDPEQGLKRRHYVLQRMLQVGKIDEVTFRQAQQQPVTARIHSREIAIDAGYAAEMARAWVFERYGADAYTRGLKVETSLDPLLQARANNALRRHLLEYERRHDYRGPEANLLSEDGSMEQAVLELGSVSVIGDLQPALITDVSAAGVTALTREGEQVVLQATALSWAADFLYKGEDANPNGFRPGDLIRLARDKEQIWQLAQIPAVQGALVSLDSADGSIQAVTGGFDFEHSHFNRVTQADRQPGSNFKPFLYSAALSQGFTPASVINDAPLVFNDDTREGGWRPQNYSGKFFGPTRLRAALTKSRNLVSVRLLQAMGVNRTREFCLRFGFPAEKLPRNLSLALGSGAMTPLELIGGYAVLANGGYRVEPHLVTRVLDQRDQLLWESASPKVPPPESSRLSAEKNGAEETGMSVDPVDEPPAGIANDEPKDFAPPPATRILPQAEVFLINSMLRDVIKRGTGRRALRLGRKDLAGKTGTTNNQMDAWFSGYAAGVVTTAWVGFDRPRSLGRLETGARAALPIWIDYMEQALAGVPEQPLEQPADIVSARVRADTGQLADADDDRAIFEFFKVEDFDKLRRTQNAQSDDGSSRAGIF
ncbi:MAG: penicillin-binding protein 1A [Gammaproteobacteria bacterium]